MKKWILLYYFLITWNSMEAKENDMGYPGDAVIHYAGCHIENVKHTEEFDTKNQAKIRLDELLKKGTTASLWEVKESK